MELLSQHGWDILVAFPSPSHGRLGGSHPHPLPWEPSACLCHSWAWAALAEPLSPCREGFTCSAWGSALKVLSGLGSGASLFRVAGVWLWKGGGQTSALALCLCLGHRGPWEPTPGGNQRPLKGAGGPGERGGHSEAGLRWLVSSSQEESRKEQTCRGGWGQGSGSQWGGGQM